MNETHVIRIAEAMGLTVSQVTATAQLFEEGATVPFIARYRKERTGSLDEVQIAKIRDELERMRAIDDRRKAIKDSLSERQLLTAELEKALENAETLNQLEDIYQPYRPKRKTRGMAAKERGLEPLASFIFENQSGDFADKAAEFVDPAKDVADAEAALAGARDIIAENISDDAGARSSVRELFEKEGIVASKVVSGKETDEAAAKFRDYFDWKEPVATAPSHRILAMRRGESEGFLFLRMLPEEGRALDILERMFLKGSGPCGGQVKLAITDSYKRLLSGTAETHVRLETKKLADEEAVRVFANNLKELLMSSPLGGKNILAIDPGFRTGCKIVCLNRQGDLVHNDLMYLEQSARRSQEAEHLILGLCERFKIEAVAIGNGTAGRETEAFVRRLNLPKHIVVVLVNESGASIYSASEVAREEFPNHDITVRGAVSIGRRLMDPLAELVKLDPQSIGVGQYQHDVSQPLLKRTLDDVVVHCVNSVGVEVNTASKQLLSYVSGLNATVASNIVRHREENGPFASRKSILKVKGLGAKTFEQAAGFLRIREAAENPLDASAVHPERYELVGRMAKELGTDVPSLMKDESLRKRIDLSHYVSDDIGLPTLRDILQELGKPGRDPREKFEAFSFTEGVNTMDDLKEGMRLPGIVSNVTAFGAFVDIGVHQDGLVHVSELADHFVKDPNEVVKPQQKVTVTVMEVDKLRKRIALSMKTAPQKKFRTPGETARSDRRPSGGDRSSQFSSRPTQSFNNNPFAGLSGLDSLNFPKK